MTLFVRTTVAMLLLVGCDDDKSCSGTASCARGVWNPDLCECDTRDGALEEELSKLSCGELNRAHASAIERIPMLSLACSVDQDCTLFDTTHCAGGCPSPLARASVDAAVGLVSVAQRYCQSYADKGCQLPPIPDCEFGAAVCTNGTCTGR